ncbi:hypothetical protein AMECASPLE_036422 [Ameca splendens]|uniref:Uncharacterized protein n=1 Tax=Ameca splendens TaxID=208324 RepID=A0ABV0YVN2_9TELE
MTRESPSSCHVVPSPKEERHLSGRPLVVSKQQLIHLVETSLTPSNLYVYDLEKRERKDNSLKHSRKFCLTFVCSLFTQFHFRNPSPLCVFDFVTLFQIIGTYSFKH